MNHNVFMVNMNHNIFINRCAGIIPWRYNAFCSPSVVYHNMIFFIFCQIFSCAFKNFYWMMNYGSASISETHHERDIKPVDDTISMNYVIHTDNLHTGKQNLYSSLPVSLNILFGLYNTYDLILESLQYTLFKCALYNIAYTYITVIICMWITK